MRQILKTHWLMTVVFAIVSLAVGGGSALASAPDFAGSPASRVVIVENPGAVSAFTPREDKVLEMVQQGILRVTGKPTVSAAWSSLVQSNDTIGIKVYSAPGPIAGTRPAVVAAVVSELLTAGVPSNHIVIWDKSLSDLNRAGFGSLARRYGVRVAGSADAGYDEAAFYDTPLLGRLIWGDFEFLNSTNQSSRKSYVSKLVSQGLSKIINIAPLFNHNLTGVTGNLTSLALGSVDNTLRFESDAARLAVAVPEIYAMRELGDRVVLNITDALLCQYEGESQALLHYSVTLNQLRFSTDPVALDLLSLRELDRYRPYKRGREAKQIAELYQNAGLLELGTSDLARVQIERGR